MSTVIVGHTHNFRVAHPIVHSPIPVWFCNSPILSVFHLDAWIPHRSTALSAFNSAVCTLPPSLPSAPFVFGLLTSHSLLALGLSAGSHAINLGDQFQLTVELAQKEEEGGGQGLTSATD